MLSRASREDARERYALMISTCRYSAFSRGRPQKVPPPHSCKDDDEALYSRRYILTMVLASHVASLFDEYAAHHTHIRMAFLFSHPASILYSLKFLS